MNLKDPTEIERAIILDEDNPLKNISPDRKGIPIASELERYIYSCAQGLTSISTALEKIQISILMLENARDLLPKGSPYNESEHIEYAIENYFIRTSSLYDRCLLFTARLMDLGIANDNISHVPIVTNEHVKRANLAGPLKKIGKVCREYSTNRNSIIHHGRYNDESFMNVSAIHKANQLSVENRSKPPFDQKIIGYLTDRAIKDKLVDFYAHLEKIESTILLRSCSTYLLSDEGKNREAITKNFMRPT